MDLMARTSSLVGRSRTLRIVTGGELFVSKTSHENVCAGHPVRTSDGPGAVVIFLKLQYVSGI